MRRRDDYDEIAEVLFDLVRTAKDDDEIIASIADALRKAAGVERPRTLSRAEYAAIVAERRRDGRA